METKTWCAYNATRGCILSSQVIVSDSANQPLKVLRLIVEGLGFKAESSLWLTPLSNAPQLMRPFPFDLVYLDENLKVILGVELHPEVPFPLVNGPVASALILPLYRIESTGTQEGDQLIVCAEEELQTRIGETSEPRAVPVAVASAASANSSSAPRPAVPVATPSLPIAPLPKQPSLPFPSSPAIATTPATAVAHGTGFTVAMTSSWQISTSTMTRADGTRAAGTGPAGGAGAAAVLEPVEAQVEEAASDDFAALDIALDTETTEAEEEIVTAFTVVGSVSDGLVSDQATPAEVAESAQEEPIPAAESSVAAEPETPAEKLKTTEQGDQAEKPRVDISGASSETAPVVERAKAQAESRTDIPIPQHRELAENVPATIAVSTDSDPVTPQKKSREKKKKESVGVLVKRFLNCEDPLPERRSIIRLVSQGLIAYTGDREKTKPHEVRDVSPTGMYLRTQERWQPGAVVSLVLQRKDATEQHHEKRVGVQVRVVRCDEGGVGLTWLWPEGVEFQPWKRVHTKRSDETDADFFLRELRLASALGFLREICPTATEEVKLALHQRLSNKRVASAVDIGLKAKELFGRRECRADKLAHPDMVRRILENGSWTEDNWIRQWWAGLLASSCCADALDTSNSVFIDLLAKLTPVHLRVLSFVCHKATELIAASEPTATPDVYCTSEELIEAVGSHSLARIQQTMGQLSSLGLLAESTKPSYVAVTDKVKTRTQPTPLALKMHARCNGHR